MRTYPPPHTFMAILWNLKPRTSLSHAQASDLLKPLVKNSYVCVLSRCLWQFVTQKYKNNMLGVSLCISTNNVHSSCSTFLRWYYQSFDFCFIYFFKGFIYLYVERERERTQVGREAGRGRSSLLSGRQMLNSLSHSSIPVFCILTKKSLLGFD